MSVTPDGLGDRGTPAEDLLAELGTLDGVERVEQVAARGGAGPAVPGRGRRCWWRRWRRWWPATGRLTEVTIGTPSLEDVFIALTGRALR